MYGQLEQENLFLIQATQEAEEGLEAAQAQFTTLKVGCATTWCQHHPGSWLCSDKLGCNVWSWPQVLSCMT